MEPITDYSDLNNWAVCPGKLSTAEEVPSFLKETVPKARRADVFFIHPTTYICQDHGRCALMIEKTEENCLKAGKNTDPWNASVKDEKLNALTDRGPIRHQASIFNQSCRIFAPRYRQAHLKAFFLQETSEAVDSLKLAYSDIQAAFRYYLEHYFEGGPLFIAGHSQGSFHGVQLLKDYFDDGPLKKDLVAAYLPGIQIKRETFKQLPLLVHPDTTGGFLSWRSFQRGSVPEELPAEGGNTWCVNPLTWSDTHQKIVCEKAPGLVHFDQPMTGSMAVTIEPKTRVLLVDLPDSAPMKKYQNLHLYDYRLFWTQVRSNVKVRLDRFLDTGYSD